MSIEKKIIKSLLNDEPAAHHMIEFRRNFHFPDKTINASRLESLSGLDRKQLCKVLGLDYDNRITQPGFHFAFVKRLNEYVRSKEEVVES